jgi:transcriptional regulator with XRE-family HTH domain
MIDYQKATGQLLRELRAQRGLTLQAAEERMHCSAASLSRKERGEVEITREDIRRAIRAYGLNPSEALRLWSTAGLLPEPVTTSPLPGYDIRDLAEALLPGLNFPALIVDEWGYVRAWNQAMEELWSITRLGLPGPHIVDIAYSDQARERLGELWETRMWLVVNYFYRRTLPRSADPALAVILAELEERWGEKFICTWHEVHDEEAMRKHLGGASIGAMLNPHPSPFGVIDFLVVNGRFHFPQPYELSINIPSGAESQERYRQFRELIGEDRLYFAEED